MALWGALAYGVGTESAAAQNPFSSWEDAVEARSSTAQPVLDYTVRVDDSDTTGFRVVMHVRNVAKLANMEGHTQLSRDLIAP